MDHLRPNLFEMYLQTFPQSEVSSLMENQNKTTSNQRFRACYCVTVRSPWGTGLPGFSLHAFALVYKNTKLKDLRK